MYIWCASTGACIYIYIYMNVEMDARFRVQRIMVQRVWVYYVFSFASFGLGLWVYMV